jgi:hypothetical protein
MAAASNPDSPTAEAAQRRADGPDLILQWRGEVTRDHVRSLSPQDNKDRS